MESSYKKVAVVGSSGFVGSHLVRELINRNVEQIVCIVRGSKSVEKLGYTLQKFGLDCSHSSIEIMEGDFDDFLFLKECFSGCDAVFNCAAKVSFDKNDKKSIISTNVLITECIVEAVKECEVEHFIHLSSIASLASNGGQLIDEESYPTTLEGKSDYSKSKFYSENVVWRATTEGVNCTVLLPAVIIGDGDSRNGGSAKLTAIFSKRQLFYAEGVTGFVWVEDVARAMADVCGDKRAFSERYILCSDNLSFRELGEILSGQKSRIRLSKRMICAIQKIVKICENLKISVKISNSLLSNLINRRYYSGEKIKRDLGFNYNTLKDIKRR
ncbi:MAG: NAD-dependent epimerase/dehydratase family protein [Rikenellaceae bacterium]